MQNKKELVDNRTGKESEIKTYFSYNKSESILTFSFTAKDSSLNSYSSIHNDELYKGDVCEVFLDIGEDYYYEFEVAPNGATFVAKIINSVPIFIDDTFFQSEATIENDSYEVKMSIDLSRLGVIKSLKFNAFRIETKGIKSDLILQAYSPTLSDTFHIKECFIEM